jgi:MFS family permease
MEVKEKKSLGNVLYIGFLSFFGGISQDIFVPILPLYLANVLGFDKAFIGLSEGLVTSGVSIFQLIAGFLTDRFGKKKPIVFLGYFFSFVARPLLAITSSAGMILGLRFLDGVGKGMKDTPKDALIADSTLVGNRGKGFGIARALDTLGSVAGPLILFGLLWFLETNTQKYHIILFLTAVPLFATLAILVFKVKETPIVAKDVSITTLSLPRRFYIFLGIVALFNLGASSDAFLILRAQNVGVTLLAIPLVYALFNFVYASASIPLGSLSDRIGRKKVILLGWFAYAIAYLGFAIAATGWQIWFIFAFYGLYYATTEGVAKAFVADIVGSERRGRAYGIYNMVVGLISLPASFIAGELWDRVNPAAPFYFGAAIAVVAFIALVFFVWFSPEPRQNQE